MKDGSSDGGKNRLQSPLPPRRLFKQGTGHSLGTESSSSKDTSTNHNKDHAPPELHHISPTLKQMQDTFYGESNWGSLDDNGYLVVPLSLCKFFIPPNSYLDGVSKLNESELRPPLHPNQVQVLVIKEGAPGGFRKFKETFNFTGVEEDLHSFCATNIISKCFTRESLTEFESMKSLPDTSHKYFIIIFSWSVSRRHVDFQEIKGLVAFSVHPHQSFSALHWLAVSPTCQRHGFGQLLLALCDWIIKDRFSTPYPLWVRYNAQSQVLNRLYIQRNDFHLVSNEQVSLRHGPVQTTLQRGCTSHKNMVFAVCHIQIYLYALKHPEDQDFTTVLSTATNQCFSGKLRDYPPQDIELADILYEMEHNGVISVVDPCIPNSRVLEGFEDFRYLKSPKAVLDSWNQAIGDYNEDIKLSTPANYQTPLQGQESLLTGLSHLLFNHGGDGSCDLTIINNVFCLRSLSKRFLSIWSQYPPSAIRKYFPKELASLIMEPYIQEFIQASTPSSHTAEDPLHAWSNECYALCNQYLHGELASLQPNTNMQIDFYVLLAQFADTPSSTFYNNLLLHLISAVFGIDIFILNCSNTSDASTGPSGILYSTGVTPRGLTIESHNRYVILALVQSPNETLEYRYIPIHTFERCSTLSSYQKNAQTSKFPLSNFQKNVQTSHFLCVIYLSVDFSYGKYRRPQPLSNSEKFYYTTDDCYDFSKKQPMFGAPLIPFSSLQDFRSSLDAHAKKYLAGLRALAQKQAEQKINPSGTMDSILVSINLASHNIFFTRQTTQFHRICKTKCGNYKGICVLHDYDSTVKGQWREQKHVIPKDWLYDNFKLPFIQTVEQSSPRYVLVPNGTVKHVDPSYYKRFSKDFLTDHPIKYPQGDIDCCLPSAATSAFQYCAESLSSQKIIPQSFLNSLTKELSEFHSYSKNFLSSSSAQDPSKSKIYNNLTNLSQFQHWFSSMLQCANQIWRPRYICRGKCSHDSLSIECLLERSSEHSVLLFTFFDTGGSCDHVLGLVGGLIFDPNFAFPIQTSKSDHSSFNHCVIDHNARLLSISTCIEFYLFYAPPTAMSANRFHHSGTPISGKRKRNYRNWLLRKKRFKSL
jgi:hypothetical protein